MLQKDPIFSFSPAGMFCDYFERLPALPTPAIQKRQKDVAQFTHRSVVSVQFTHSSVVSVQFSDKQTYLISG
jgi:hypothetical protein